MVVQAVDGMWAVCVSRVQACALPILAVTVTSEAAPAVRGLPMPVTDRAVAGPAFTLNAELTAEVRSEERRVGEEGWVPVVLRVSPQAKVWTPASPATKV